MKKGKENNNPTNPKDKVDPIKKQGAITKNPRDLLPPNSQHLKNIRETFPIKQIDISADENKEIKEVLIFSKPFEVLPEWPSEEELKVFSSSQETECELFTDPFNKRIIFLKQFEENFEKEATWLRPQEYIKNNLLNKEIKISFPNKNLFKMRTEIKEFYMLHELPNRQSRKGSTDNNNKNIDNDEENYYLYDNQNNKYQFNAEPIEKSNLGDKTQIDVIEMLNKKRNSFQDCFKILDKNLDIKIVNWSEREENDEEFKKRKEEEMQEKLRQMEKEKESKNKKKPGNNQAAPNKPLQQVKDALGLKADLENFNRQNSEERLKIKEIKPSNLYFLNDPKYNSYLKWILSILQMIKDLNLSDVQTGKSIISNIYPQKEGFPVVSASGKYWIKLHLMGKARLVEIDDLIPCNKNEEFIFPRCDRLEEIWPALLTKAIIKLHSYKRISKYSEETGDLSVIYSLTGYITEKLPINSIRIANIEKYLQSNDNYLQKHKILACLAWNEEEKIISTTKISPVANKNEKSKAKRIDSTRNNNISKAILNKLSSKTSIVSLNSNLSQIPEEMQKLEDDNPANLNSKKNTSIGKKRKSSNSKVNSYFSNPNQIKAFSERIVIGTPTNDNYINFLKNIPEENNFELDDMNIKEPDEYNKNNDSSAFNSVNNENSSNIIESNNNNNLNKNDNNQAINDPKINSNENYSLKIPKNHDLAPRIKNTFSDIKANKFDFFPNKPRRSSVAFLIPKGKEELKIENPHLESNNNIDPETSKKLGTNENLFFNTIEANIAPQGKYETEGQTGQKYIVSLGRNFNNVLKSSKNIIKFDFNLDLAEKQDSQKRDDIIFNYLYPILDFFDNKKFNMQRLKPLDFSDIKKIGQEGRTPGIYKQLSKEDKKKYLENLLEVKTKQREMKNKRIEEIKTEGRRYNFIKIKNNTIGIPKLDFYVPHSEQEILMTKKCLENRWEFPPPSYYDNYEAENKERNETTLSLTEGNVISTYNDFQDKKANKADELTKSPKKQPENNIENSPKKVINNTLSPVRQKNKNNKLIDLDPNDKLNIYQENEFKENFKEDPLINAIEERLNQEKLGKKKDAKIKTTNKKSSNWSREVYLNIINHNLDQYNNSNEPLAKYNGGNWLNYSEFRKYFNFFILLHHPKSFKFQICCDNLWIYNNDSYEYNINTSVIFLNNLSENLTDNTEEVELDPNNIDSKYVSISKREKIVQQKKSSLLILFEPNNTNIKSKEFEELFYYANFDLTDSYGKEIQSNIILSKSYSTHLNENLEKEKNYFLILKSFVCPFGFTFSVYSDHVCDNMDYGTYLKKFYGYVNKVFKIDHSALERNRTSLISKFKIKLDEKTYFKINLNHPEKLSKKFMELYLYFGKSTQIKKRISFDLNEKILFEPLPEEDEYILALVINPPYVINSNSLEVDFFYDKTNAKIDLLETLEPFKLCDRIKANKYGIVFKEFIFAFENTLITLDLKVQKRKNFNFSENTNPNLNSDFKTPNPIASSNKNLNIIHKNSSINYSENINSNYLQKLLYCEEDLQEKLRMKLQILKSNEVLFEEEFFNKITIQNILFNNDAHVNSPTSDTAINLNLTNQKTSNNLSSAQINNLYSKETQPYLIKCVIDLSELKIPKESLENLEWVLRVYSSEPVIFTKDTSKEDSEKFLKDNWENKEPGRSEKARKSRLKHLIMCKKNMGKVLSPDEEQLLLEDRPKTVATASLLQHLESNNLKGARDNEKDKKNVNKKVSNNVTNSKAGNNQKTNTNLPKLDVNAKTINNTEESTKSLLKLGEMKKLVIANPYNHKNHYIRDFLNYTIQERIIQKDNLIEKDKKIVLDEHNLKKINEQINKHIENYELIRKTEGDETLNKSVLSRENLKTFYKTTNTFRIKARDNCSQLYKQRDLLKNDLIKVIEIENSINEILSNFNSDMNYSVRIYKESSKVEGVKPKLRERLFQFISSKKDEFYKTEIKKLTNKDRNNITKYVEDIEENKWFVSPEIMIKFKELMQDSNPKK